MTILFWQHPGEQHTAMLIAAFMIHGLQPGPLLYSQRPDIIFGIFVAMLVTNIFLVALSIVGVRMFQLNRLPYSAFGGHHGPVRHRSLRAEEQRG
jgi:putative tricarboxylic transport membrane protein